MSLTHKTYYPLLLVMTVTSVCRTQTYAELGSVSGTGIVMLPSTSTAPSAQFRFNACRIDYLHQGYRGINIYEMSAGFSPNLEGYIKFAAEDYSSTASVSSVGFGAKFQLPFVLPIVDHAAMWGETNYSEDTHEAIFPTTINRAGILASFEGTYTKAIFLIGMSGETALNRVLLGSGYTVGLHHSLQLGSEFLYGYTDIPSMNFIINVSYRLFSNVSIHVSPGYLKTTSVATVVFSAGISFSTAKIDFMPVREQKKDEFHIPSFEEIEKQSKEEKQ